MTQEEKAKAYDEALEKARMYRDNAKAVEEYSAVARYENIFPELRESEDERIRKGIVETIKQCPDTFLNPKNRDRMLAYLEKQKESLHIQETSKENADSFTSKQMEQKPELVQHPPITYTYNSNASRDERLKAALLALLNSDLLKVKKGGYFTKQDLIDWVEKQQEQKPAEWSEEYIADVFEKVGLAKVVREQGNDELTNAVQSAMIELSKGYKQEWSEEDEEALDMCLDAIPKKWKTKSGILLTKWLKDNIQPQPKPEWSEDDKEMLECVIMDVEKAKENYLKSTMQVVQQGAIIADKELAWLKSLRPCPSWKPSEEHLSALLAVFNDPNNIGSQTCQLALSDLYEQLLKLK